jgi:hypothetical protein
MNCTIYAEKTGDGGIQYGGSQYSRWARYTLLAFVDGVVIAARGQIAPFGHMQSPK